MHMERVLIQFNGEQIGFLRRRAKASDQSVSAVVREAVSAFAQADRRAALVKLAMGSLDGYPSGILDLAENHDLYLDDDPAP